MSQHYLSVHPHSEKIPLAIEFLSSDLSWIGPVVPPLNIGRFLIC